MSTPPGDNYSSLPYFLGFKEDLACLVQDVNMTPLTLLLQIENVTENHQGAQKWRSIAFIGKREGV